MSIPRLWLFLAVALPTVAAIISPLSTVDLTYHVRAGGEILSARAIPATDTWTFTATGLPWRDQQWGAQLVFAVVERLGGWTGLVIERAAATAAIFGSVMLLLRRDGLDTRTAALLTISSFLVAAPALAMRPQLLGMVCLAVILVLIAARRSASGRRWIWLAPVVVALWANLHGSFFLGPAVLGLAWLEDLFDRVQGAGRTLAVAGVSAAAACLTPFGPTVWAYAVGLSTDPTVTSMVSEWQPTTIRDGVGMLFYASVAAVVVVIARQGRPVRWPTLIWLGFFFVIGAYAQRGLAWWALGAVVAVGTLLSSASGERAPAPEERPTVRRLNAAVAVVLVAISLIALPLWRPADAGLRAPLAILTYAPSGITGALRDTATPGDRVFNPQVWGSWFEYALPHLSVAVDSRIEVIPRDVWTAYEGVLQGAPGWQEILRDWGVTTVVTTSDENAFRDRLVADGWHQTFQDGDGTILAHP